MQLLQTDIYRDGGSLTIEIERLGEEIEVFLRFHITSLKYPGGGEYRELHVGPRGKRTESQTIAKGSLEEQSILEMIEKWTHTHIDPKEKKRLLKAKKNKLSSTDIDKLHVLWLAQGIKERKCQPVE